MFHISCWCFTWCATAYLPFVHGFALMVSVSIPTSQNPYSLACTNTTHQKLWHCSARFVGSWRFSGASRPPMFSLTPHWFNQKYIKNTLLTLVLPQIEYWGTEIKLSDEITSHGLQTYVLMVVTDNASRRQDSLRQDSLKPRLAYHGPGFKHSCTRNERKTHWSTSTCALASLRHEHRYVWTRVDYEIYWKILYLWKFRPIRIISGQISPILSNLIFIP